MVGLIWVSVLRARMRATRSRQNNRVREFWQLLLTATWQVLGVASVARTIQRRGITQHECENDGLLREDSVYSPALSRRRCRMRRSLFEFVLRDVRKFDGYFVQKADACDLVGLSPKQKIIYALRVLCYGLCACALRMLCY